MTLGDRAIILLDFATKPLPKDDWRAMLAFADVSTQNGRLRGR